MLITVPDLPLFSAVGVTFLSEILGTSASAHRNLPTMDLTRSTKVDNPVTSSLNLCLNG